MADTAVRTPHTGGAENHPATSWTDRLRAFGASFAGRVLAMALLAAVACGVDYLEHVQQALAGSRSPLSALLPVLIVLAATGYRRAPHGVADNETDWIFAALLCGLALAAVWLVSDRYPTLTGLWQLHSQVGVLFAACCAMILFGVRHTARLWPVWLFAFVAAAPVFHMLAVAELGGSDAAVAYVCVAFGTVAAAMASMQATLRWRLLITALSAVLGVAAVQLLDGRIPLFATATVAGAAVPVVTIVALWRRAHPARPTARHAKASRNSGDVPRFPTRSWRSLTGLVVIAIALGLLQSPHSTAATTVSAVDGWTERAGLTPVADLPFITDFLGPDSSMVRYAVPRRAGVGIAAVDVITTENPAVLGDYRDAVWYRSPRPLNYHETAPVPGSTEVALREIQSDAETVTPDSPDWYALTWNWRTDAGYQQVTVIVNQNPVDSAEPPLPQPLCWRTTVLYPLLWHSRQQTDAVTTAPPAVVQYARSIAADLIGSGYPSDA
jgi:hypothetical protein